MPIVAVAGVLRPLLDFASCVPAAIICAPRLPHCRWISLLGALMSCGYCSIAIVMSILHATKHGPATQWRHEGISQVGLLLH